MKFTFFLFILSIQSIWGQMSILDIREGLLGQPLENTVIYIKDYHTQSMDTVYLLNATSYGINFPNNTTVFDITVSHPSLKYKSRSFQLTYYHRNKQIIYLYPTDELEREYTEQRKKESAILSNATGNQFNTASYQEAEFIGGESKMREFLNQSIVYPIEAYDNNLSGKSVIRFAVEKDGSISITNTPKTSGIELFDDEAKRVIRSMPNWNPETDENGNTRKAFFSIPVNFSSKF